MRLKIILMLGILMFVFITITLLNNYRLKPNDLAFENSDSIKLESPYLKTANVYKGQLHSHTTNSDGSQSPLTVAEAYKNASYDFIAITDHDYITPNPGIGGLLFFTGNEVSSSLGDMITMNVLSAPPTQISQKVIDWTKNQRGLIWLAHPNRFYNHWAIKEIARLSIYNGIEVYNHNRKSYAEDKWDYILTDLDRQITALAVDDCHNVKNNKKFNGGWVMVFADSLTKKEIVKSLEKGNFYSTQGPIIHTVEVEDNIISIKLKQSATITWIGAGGSVLQETEAAKEDSYVVRGNEKYIRIRVEGSGYAWTNPIQVLL